MGSTGLACGRPSEAFWSLQEIPEFNCHRCRVCFGDQAGADEDTDDADSVVKLEELEEPQLLGSEGGAPQRSPGRD